MPLKIRSIDTFVMGVPGRNWTFVKVLTDEGVHGWGEATNEWHEPAVVEYLKLFSSILIGRDPTRIEEIWQLIFRHHWWRSSVAAMSALSGIDQALWDIAGKVCGQPVYRLLGGACHDRIRLYAREDRGLGSTLEEGIAAREEGFTAFKSGVEHNGSFDENDQIREMARNCKELRRSLGDGFDIMLDLQGVFTASSVLKLSRMIADLDILWIEEPVSGLDLEGATGLVAANLGVRFATGERLVARWGFKDLLEKRGADIIQPDVCHTGGISELRRVAALAEMYGVPVAPHNPLGPVATAAAVHTAAAMPNFLILEYCRRSALFHEVQTAGIRIEQGYAHLPSAPGLGVDLDESVIAQHGYHPMPLRMWVRPDGSIPMV